MSTEALNQVDLLVRLRNAAALIDPGMGVESLSEMSSGSSGLTFRCRVTGSEGGTRWAVVKVAPPGLEPIRNRDVLRQAAMQRALRTRSGVPVADVLIEDAGVPPQVPPFYVMSEEEGECFEPLIDAIDVLPDPAELESRARHAAQVLASLHAVGPAELGFDGEPAVTLGQEVERWSRVFATTEPTLRPAADECAAALRSSIPSPLPTTIVHGDFRLGNIICSAGRVRAVLDWEIWSRSDPRVDVAWFLMVTDRSGPSVARDDAPGFPAAEELLAEYEASSGRHLEDLQWFAALSRFRSAAAMALNVKHNRRRPHPVARIEAYAPILPTFLRRATELLDK